MRIKTALGTVTYVLEWLKFKSLNIPSAGRTWSGWAPSLWSWEEATRRLETRFGSSSYR